MEMNKLSSNITKIVEKWNDFKESSEKDRKYLVKQIGKGQYCNQHSVGWFGDSFEGTYYFPIEDGRYLAVEYSC